MKYLYSLLFLAGLAMHTHAQVGIGTVSPNSMLDLRGSFAPIFRSFAAATSLTTNDHTVVFTGASAATATLPDASTCAGRIYCVKNFSITLPAPVLTIGTVSSQKIDGIGSWLLNQSNQSVMLISDGANWEIFGQSSPSSGTFWNQGGNVVAAATTLGTTTAFDLPFITNNTEKMRITSAGNVGIGSTAFAASAEALLVYQNSASSINVISAKGSLNNYLQLNVQNLNNGSSASSDIVATADNGTELINYVDMGINSSTYATGTVTGGINNAYLFSAANDFAIGNSIASKNLIFFTGGIATGNERMRIDGSGNLGLGTTAPVQKLDVNGNFRLNGAFMPSNSAGTAGNVLFSAGPGLAPFWFDASGYLATVDWVLGGNGLPSMETLGTTSNFSLPIITNNVERMRVDSMGNIAIGGQIASGASNAEKLLINAGTTTSPNLVSAKGSINNFLQLNVQNTSAAGLASTDLVATNDAGSYVDLGINSSGYVVNASPILSGIGNSYLYSTGNDFIIGDSTVGKNVIFFTGGAALINERMRITGAGNIGINSTAPASTLQLGGSLGLPVTTKTAGYTVSAGDYTILCNNTSGAITILLPTAAGIAGRIYVIKKISVGGNNVLVDASGAQTIDGSAVNTITTQYASITIQSDGSNWFIL